MPTPTQNPATQTAVPQGLDPIAYTLTKAIGLQESGGNYQAQGASGEYGAYQNIPATWNARAQAVYGANAPAITDATPEQQNEVMYNWVSSKLKAGYTAAQIASMQNAGDGAPNAYLGNSGTNADGVQYNTPAYVAGVQKYASQLWDQQNNPTTAGPNQPVISPIRPSLGGFLSNTLSSAANFAGNIGNAIIHPIQTVQNLAEIPIGGLQELGGQQNQNTQTFDNVVNYFKQRYGSVNDLLHTAYTDPVGLAADVSAALGVGAGAAGLAGKAAELSTAADASRAADLAASTGVRTMTGDVASGNGLTRGLGAAQGALEAGSALANPLSPIIAGAGKLIGKTGLVTSEVGSQLTGFEPQTIDTIIAHPDQFTPEQIANTSRLAVAKDVESALQDREASVAEDSRAYGPVRESPTTFPVAKNFLEDQLRSQAGVDVKDGEIVAKGSSKIRASKDVAALQNLFDTWKPEFQKGSLTSEEFLNFRQDLASVAKYDREFTASKPVESVAASIRSSFNKTYRPAIPGLDKLDESYSTQRAELQILRKGILDKDGNLQDSAINKIANATGKGKDLQLAKLEQISPGITKRIQILKAMEDIQKAGGTKVGTYPSAFLKAGGVIAGLATGNIPVLATALATTIIASPGIAVPLLRLFGEDKGIVSGVMAHLAKYVTLGAVTSATQNDSTGQIAPDIQASATTDQQTGSTPQQIPAPSQPNSDIPSANTTPAL
jgi:hypothetical protein